MSTTRPHVVRARSDASSHAARARLAIELVVVYTGVRLTLRRHPVAEAVTALRARARAFALRAPGTITDREALRLGRATARVLERLPTDSRCLMRSLVLVTLLCRRGVETTLVIAAKPGPQFGAHAWVEREGRALLDPGDEDYGRLLEL